MVARLHVGDLRADLLDDARGLVAGDDDGAVRNLGVDGVQVAVAEPRADHADQHFVRGGLVDDQVDEVELSRRLQDGGFHEGPPGFCWLGRV